jgi:hypothetical protein
MMAYTDEDGYTCFIFADPNIEKVLFENREKLSFGTQANITGVVGTLQDLWKPEQDHAWIVTYAREIVAYLYSCLSIPLDQQMVLLKDGAGSSGSDALNEDLSRLSFGGAKDSKICGTIIGLVVAVALAFVKR